MRSFLKALAARLARSRPVRSVVGNLIYPTIVDCLRSEARADVHSPSGVVEAFSWKAHAYLVLNEELRPTGLSCSSGSMGCDRESRSRIIDTVLSKVADIEGDILEFGVSEGESLRIFAERCPARHIYGFDSFEGLPAAWWTRPKGTFKADPPDVDKPNVTLVRGLFDDSVPDFIEKWNGWAAVVHVDCDLYKSSRTCLTSVLPKCQVGTIILFDEYYNYPEFWRHEWLAWRQIRASCGVEATCVAYDGRRAAFQICRLGELERAVGGSRILEINNYEYKSLNG